MQSLNHHKYTKAKHVAHYLEYVQGLSKSRAARCPREFRYFKPVNDDDMLIDYRVAMSPITYGPNDGCTSMASA
jgi:hypothetical protein